MANVMRTAKSGSDWTANELVAYNIRVELEDATTFFGTSRLPDPVITPGEVLEVAEANQTTTDDGYALLRTLDLAMSIPPDEESAVDDFAVALFRACGYARRGRVIRTRKDLPLVICGENRHAKVDVCILDDNEIILLVQEYKRHLGGSDPEPQLIAEAIAAFAANNKRRERTLNLPPLQSKVIPAITLEGSSPIFYKIPVTTDLVTAVQSGLYPGKDTVVHAHIPAVPRPARRWSEGCRIRPNTKWTIKIFSNMFIERVRDSA